MLPVSVLDVPVTHLDRRVGLCLGSTDEVGTTLLFYVQYCCFTHNTIVVVLRIILLFYALLFYVQYCCFTHNTIVDVLRIILLF